MSIQQVLLAGGDNFTPVSRTYTGPIASGTDTVPTGATSCFIQFWSAGASGSRVAAGTNAGGGGSGGYEEATITPASNGLTAGATFLHVLAGGGAAQNTVGNAGNAPSGSAIGVNAGMSPFTMTDGPVAQGGGTTGTGGAGAVMANTGTEPPFNGNAGTGGVISGQGGNWPNGGSGGPNSATVQNAGGTPGGGGGAAVATSSGA